MDIGIVRQVNIDDQMRDSYLDYAMSVIVARALPDARDGLKPVHRRILYAMSDMGLRANSAYKKSARIVGEVLGKYHPHGDSAVYEAMARMAQEFSMRYPLVDGQGNFGSIDGDSPAAMRYTEARLARIAEEMLADLNMNTVDWTDNFDGSLQEPEVLPARLPNLLLNGASGIAVGMATNIPPHNLRELAAAISYMIDNYDRLDDVSVDDLMQFVTAPDFPTGAIIIGGEELREVYATGRGRLTVRAVAEIEEMKGGERHRIVITEIPYQLNKVAIIERLAELVREGRLDAISDLRDESDRHGLRIVIELKRNAQPQKVLNQIYKYTQLQSTFSVQMLALVDGEPLTISLKRALKIYIDHRRVVITRRSQFELDKAKTREHILIGYRKALDNIDDIIETIRAASSTEEARSDLIVLFDLSETQAQAILELQLRRLAALERQKIEDEYQQVRSQIDYLEDLLAHTAKVLALIKSDLTELAEKYGDKRRTRLDMTNSATFDESDLIRDENVLISITKRGYIKRTPATLYRAQNRGGRGVTGMTTREEDVLEHLVSANSLDHLLLFTNKGKVYAQRSYQIPETDRSGKGTLINSLIALEPEEEITAVARVADFESGFFILCTRKARIKRVHISDFASVRSNGLIAMSIDTDDQLRWVKRTSGEDHVILVTAHGRSIRFLESEVRVMGRQASGVNAIRLRDGDWLAALDVIDPATESLLVVTTKGYGKRTLINEYPLRGRFGLGVRTIAPTASEKIGPIISAHVLRPTDDITVITREGMALRTRGSTIRLAGRVTKGVKIIKIARNDQIVSVAVLEGSPVEASEEGGDVAVAPNGHEPGEDVLDLPTDTVPDGMNGDEDSLDETLAVPTDEIEDEDDDSSSEAE
ncbi:MAG TPA: DNA gyrase subunit A [Aggregatilineales bacterium]|nr:DNA gyrase subunit A [Aggregatilineales bacterium]